MHSLSVLNMALNKVKILYTDLKPEINKFFFAIWYHYWNNIYKSLLDKTCARRKKYEPPYSRMRNDDSYLKKI